MRLQTGRYLLAGVIGVAAWLAAAAEAGAVNPLPQVLDRPVEEQFTAAPAPWRDYFIAVRGAQAIGDAMARCLAWPDLPGSRLPEGNVRAHCQYHYSPMPTPAEVEGHVDAGTLDALSALLERRFAAHHGAADPDESVHLFYNVFAVLARSDADAADRITRRWLEAAPGSAHATLARARVLAEWGWKARGGKYASETRREQFAAMEAHFAEAVPLYLRAIELDPRLTDPYAGLITISMSGREGGLEDWALEQAGALVPGCQEVAAEYMKALQPKWGGSFDAMMAYVRLLEPAMASAPLLANQRAAPYAAIIDVQHRAGSYTAEAAAAIDDVVLRTTNDEMFSLAAAVAFHRTDDSPSDESRGVGYLLQRLRFNGLTAWELQKLSAYFVRGGEPEWALAFASGAVELSPDSPVAHYHLADANFALRRYEEAERHYLVARAEPELAERALSEAINVWASAGIPHDALVDRVEPYIDELLERFPENGRGRTFHVLRLGVRGQLRDADIDAFLASADASDPVQATMVEALEEMRALEGAAARPAAGTGEATGR